MTDRLFYIFILLTCILLPGCSMMPTEMKDYSQITQESSTLPHKLYLPQAYNESPQKKWPLLLFLHGAGERGTDLDRLELHGPPALIKKGQFPPDFIVLAPQCPKEIWWPEKSKAVYQLLQNIKNTYRIDHGRIYLSGLSMGGFGAWDLAATYPHEFAAVVPICGGGDPGRACKMKSTPIWAFHGAKDTVIPKERSLEMVQAIQGCGSNNVKLTIYPDATHDSWSMTYSNPALYKWLLSHKNNPAK